MPEGRGLGGVVQDFNQNRAREKGKNRRDPGVFLRRQNRRQGGRARLFRFAENQGIFTLLTAAIRRQHRRWG
jgi:hypothetical protein